MNAALLFLWQPETKDKKIIYVDLKLFLKCFFIPENIIIIV